MGWPVAWLKRMISAREFDQWVEYYKRRPFDDESVHQTHVAQLTSIYVNAHQKGNTKPTSAADFLLFRDNESETAPDLDAKFRRFFASYPDPA